MYGGAWTVLPLLLQSVAAPNSWQREGGRTKIRRCVIIRSVSVDEGHWMFSVARVEDESSSILAGRLELEKWQQLFDMDEVSFLGTISDHDKSQMDLDFTDYRCCHWRVSRSWHSSKTFWFWTWGINVNDTLTIDSVRLIRWYTWWSWSYRNARNNPKNQIFSTIMRLKRI